MPKVPVSNIPSVSPGATPQGVLRVGISPEQFGAGVGRGFQSVAQNVAKMQQEDDAAAATDMFNQASEVSRKHLYEGNEAVYSQKGKNALGSHDKSRDFFNDTFSGFSGNLANDNQRKAFKSLWDRRTNTNLDNVARHEAGERKVYFEDTQKANLVSNMSHAANNFDKPDEVEVALQNADTIIRSNPMGSSEEVVLQKQAQAKSEIHKSVVDRMMIDDPDGARQYYNANKDGIDGAHHKEIESALKGNKQKRQAQTEADKIMQSTKTDAEKRSAAKKVNNPEVRALTEGLVNQDINREKTDRIENEREMNEAFWTAFIPNPDINSIPENLPAKTKLAAIKYAQSPTSRKTDLAVWNEINQLTIDDPDAFIAIDLFDHVNDLDESDFQAFGKLQRTLGTDKQTLTHVQSVGSKATKALKDIGKKVASEDGQLFMRKFQDEVSALESAEKRKIQPTEVDSIIDRLMIEGEIPGFVYDPNKRVFQLDPTEIDEFFIEDVPKAERDKILQAYKNRGIEPTEEQIVDLYTKKVTKK